MNLQTLENAKRILDFDKAKDNLFKESHSHNYYKRLMNGSAHWMLHYSPSVNLEEHLCEEITKDITECSDGFVILCKIAEMLLKNSSKSKLSVLIITKDIHTLIHSELLCKIEKIHNLVYDDCSPLTLHTSDTRSFHRLYTVKNTHIEFLNLDKMRVIGNIGNPRDLTIVIDAHRSEIENDYFCYSVSKNLFFFRNSPKMKVFTYNSLDQIRFSEIVYDSN